MSVTINGIACEEIVAQFSESFDFEAGIQCRKGFLCDWADRYSVVVGLIGIASSPVVNGAITLQASSPWPELAQAYCRNVTVEPQGRVSQGTYQEQWPKCIVWATYGTLPWFQQGGPQLDPGNPLYAEQTLDVSVEYITIPGRGLKFSGGQPVGQDYGVRIALVDMSITFHWLPYVPTNAILAAGKINENLFLGVNPGHLLFNGVRTTYSQQVDGTSSQDATYSFSFRPIARWDYGLCPETGTWLQIVTQTGSNPVIDSHDFSTSPIFPTINRI